jgi:catechol 2,3-dioxygenase-like lactoylglutathione lyase family enzyme
MIQGIDHIVIAVRDLAQASADYQQAGFTVTPGGEHTGGVTHNALIAFADGAYFELLAFTQPDRPQEHKWWEPLSSGEGTVDFALISDGLAADADRLRQSSLTVDGPRDGGRVRPDGQRIAWRTLGLSGGDVPLPFLIEDVTARDLRVPSGAATEHALGVTGVAGLTIVVPDLDRAAQAYTALLGTSGEASHPPLAGLARTRRFACGRQWLELAEPAAGAEDPLRHLRVHPAGPYEIVLIGSSAAAVPLALAHVARISVEMPE